MSFPAEKIAIDNFHIIKEKNQFLDELLKEKNQIQRDLCVLPRVVKRADDLEKKDKLEQRLERVNLEVFKIKRFLREFKVTNE